VIANGHAAALPSFQTWLVAAGPLGHQMRLPADDRPLTENELAVAHNIASMRIDQTRRMMDPRRDVREAAGVPRTIPDALAFLRLYQDDAVAGAVVERYPDETYKVPGEVWDGDSSPYGSGSVGDYQDATGDETASMGGAGGGGSEADLAETGGRAETVGNAARQTDETPFNAAWAELQAMLRTGGQTSYYKGEEYSPFWRLMRDWDVASRVCRYGVLFAGLDDGRRLDEPAAGLEEEGSVGDGFEFDYMTNAGVDPESDEYDDPKRVRDGGWADRGGRKVVFNVEKRVRTGATTNAAGEPPPYSLTYNADSPGAKKMKGSKKPLLYCRVFTEAHAVPVMWERNRKSPRYGQPTMWHVDFGDPLAVGAVTGPSDTARVHWTRVRALKSDARFNSNVLSGVPACWPVYPEIYNLQKIGAAGGEGYWVSGLPLTYFKTPAAIAGARTVVRKQLVRDEWERMNSSLADRMGIFENLEPGQLAPTMVDPTPFEDANYKKIAVALNMPMRKLIGDPQGALAAAGEDTGDWDDVVRGRQQKRAIPEQVVPAVDWFIQLGLLPEPQGGEFDCGWPAVDSLTQVEQADVMAKVVGAMDLFVKDGLDAIMAPEDLYVEFLKKTPEEARAYLERAAEASAQRQQDEMDQQVEQQHTLIDEGLTPDPTAPPPPPPPGEPITVKPGDKLVDHPSNAKPGMRPRTLAQGNPLPKKPSPNGRPKKAVAK
jgi:hypothetical protein